MQLNRARILLTGATGGLGEALASHLSAAGAALLLTGRNEDKLAAIPLVAGAECVRLQADLATPRELPLRQRRRAASMPTC
jgi:NADP-dependent 3-hydroxy acid dehydrogenase YdfG